MFLLFSIVLLLSSLSQVLADIYLPSLPFIALNFKVSEHLVQLSLFYFMTGLATSQLFYGSVSDAYGRKYPLIFGLILCVIGSLICLFSLSIISFNVGRVFQGIGAGAGVALSRSVMRDVFSGPDLAKISSYLSIANIGIITAAPFLGGYLQHWFTWQTSFVFLSLYSLTVLLLLIKSLPETNQYRHKDHIQWHNIKANLSYLLSSKQFLPYAFIIFATYACILAWLTAGPILLQQQYGLSPVGFGWLCLVVGFIYALGSFSNARLLIDYQPQTLLKMGIIILTAGGLLITVMAFMPKPNVWTVFIPVLVMLFGASLIFPNAYACLMTPFAKTAGMAGALTAFLQILGGVFASWIISHSPDSNAFPMGMTSVGAALIACVAFKYCRKID